MHSRTSPAIKFARRTRNIRAHIEAVYISRLYHSVYVGVPVSSYCLTFKKTICNEEEVWVLGATSDALAKLKKVKEYLNNEIVIIIIVIIIFIMILKWELP